jgi:putative restriction endonuclease
VDVQFQELSNRIRPKDHIQKLLPFLPEKYSPLQRDGNGLQNVYLTELNPELAASLFRFIGSEATAVRDTAIALNELAPLVLQPEATIGEWEQRVEQGIRDAPTLQRRKSSAHTG